MRRSKETPPPRPPAMKTPPKRPPLPGRGGEPPERADSQRSSSLSQHNIAFIDNNSSSNDTTKSEGRRSIALPNSPFYTPSQDLLGLDHSLFHEIGSVLSDDTRSILTLGSSATTTTSSSSNAAHQSVPVQTSSVNNSPFNQEPQPSQQMSTTNPFASTTTTITSQERQMDLLFDDDSTPDNTSQQQQQGGLHRSPVLTRTTSVPMGNSTMSREGATALSSAAASSEFDPFGPCFEEAKMDFRLTDKR